MKPNRLALLILFLTLGAGAVALTPLVAPQSRVGREWAPRLGLDIRGGMRVVLEAETDKLPQGQKWDQGTKNAILKIIRNRVDASGVAEPAIAPKGEKQFVVELPNIANEGQVLNLLQNTARLEFYYSPNWKTNRNKIGRYEFRPGGGSGGGREEYRIYDAETREEFRDAFHIAQALTGMIDAGAKARTGATPVTLPPVLAGLSAAAGKGTVPLTAEDAKRLPTLAREKESFDRFLKAAQLQLTGDDLLPQSRGQLDNANKPLVEIKFNDRGRDKFADFTRRHVDEILMIYLDGRILMAPNINEPILNGQAVISPFASLREAQQLADFLNGGALPVPLRIVQQQSVEPTLGQDAVRDGLRAGLIGVGAVLVFMAGYYLLPGLVACVALLLYTLFTYAVFTLIPVTFTLPGIAGFILSVGMAVDANILIFERTKEELRAGKSLRAAIEAGFARAFSAIFDSNVCTAITSILLFNFGTGPVRGFALTLLIGVAISMFTAITVTRTILLLMVNTGIGHNPRAWGVHRIFIPRMDVVGRRNLWFAFSLLVILPGLYFLTVGGFKPGIDFTGGSEMTLKFTRPVQRAEVERIVRSQGIEEPVVQIAQENTVYIRTPEIDQAKADTVTTALSSGLGGATREGFEVIGSSISQELTRNAFTSILFSSILIVLYLATRFAIGGFVNGMKFGICAIIAMLHDVLVVVGLFAILGYFLNWKVDTLFVTAALTVIGFSVHDTIVIFDRIREHLRHRARGESFEELVNKSINETFARSVFTSLTVLITLLSLIILGGDVIRPLNVALFIGVLSGTYSSIFNAAPLVVVWERLAGRHRGGIAAASVGGGPRPAQPATAGGPSGGGRVSVPPLTPSATDRPGPAAPANGTAATPDGSSGHGPHRTRPSAPPAPRRKRRM